MENMEKKNSRNDVILIGILLAVALMAYIGIYFYQRLHTDKAVAVVTISGEEYDRYPLDKDMTEKIELPDGSYNVLEIRDGKADITEASCPDSICVNDRAVNMNHETIVCLPNQVVVEIQNGEEAEVDVLTN